MRYALNVLQLFWSRYIRTTERHEADRALSCWPHQEITGLKGVFGAVDVVKTKMFVGAPLDTPRFMQELTSYWRTASVELPVC